MLSTIIYNLEIESLALILIISIVLFYYLRKNTNPVVFILILITWILNIYIILLLPYDIYISNIAETEDEYENEKGDEDKYEDVNENEIENEDEDENEEEIENNNNNENENENGYEDKVEDENENEFADEEQMEEVNDLQYKLKILYSVIYWSISLFSWVLIPLISEYENSGYFTRRERLLYSIKSNLLYYGLLLIGSASILGWAYYKLTDDSFSFFLEICYNFSYLIGFFYLVLFLGYSIPKMPKTIYDKIFYKKTIKDLEINAKSLKKKLEKVNKDLLDNYYKLVNISDKIQINKELKNSAILEQLENKIKDKKTEENQSEKYEKFLNKKIKYIQKNEKIFGIKIKRINFEENEEFDIKDVSDKIISLNIKLKENEWDNLRLQCQLQSTYNEWCFMKTIVKKGKKYQSSLINQKLSDSKTQLIQIDEFTPLKNISTLKIIYYMKIHPLILFFFACIFFILGIIILLSEICISLPWKVSIFNILKDWKNNIVAIHIVIFFSVFVFLFMSLYALLNFKLTKNYRIYGPRQTDTESIIYFTKHFSRIIFSLAVNILFMIHHGDDATKRTCLEKQLGINSLNYILPVILKYSPLFLIGCVLLNMCGILSKLSDCFSVETLNALFFERTRENPNEGYEYLLDFNKKNKGELLSDSIMNQIIED